MALLTLKWPASSRVNRVSSGACGGVAETGIPRRRSLPNTNAQGRRREKPRDMTASRWRTAKNMSVSGSTTKFQPKPPPPQGGHRAKNNTSFKQGPKSMDTNTGPAIASQHRKIQAVPPPKPETSSNTVKAEHTSVPSIVREDTAHDGLRLLLTGGCSSGVHEALPRSGSAPSSSAMALINPLGTTFSSSCRPTVENPPLLGEGIKIGCPTSQPEGNVANTTRSCWDERRDSIVNPVDCATPPPRCGSASTTGNKAARSTVSDGQPTEPIPRQSGPSNSSTRNGGLKVLPLLLPEQELLSKGAKTRKKRLLPLCRRKSDVVGGGVRARANNNSSMRAPTSAGSESSLSKRRSSTSGLRSPDTSRPSTTSSANTARERASSGGISRSSDSAIGLGADQGHLKARLRVMEWKRRRAEEIRTQQEEQATQEQLEQAEAETEAARKLAAARAEEAERRIVVERESTADAARAAEGAEKRAETSRQRERRRAQVYAINAVMRTACEREFEAYSLEQETRTARAVAPTSQDQPLTKNKIPPQQ